MKSLNSSLICILGWLKLDLGVVLLYFGFDLQIFGENGELPVSGKSNALRLGIGALA